MPSVATISNPDAGINCNIQITSSVRVRPSDTGKIGETATVKYMTERYLSLIFKVKTIVSVYLIPKSDATIKSMLDLIIISLSCTFEFLNVTTSSGSSE
jgi:hypothetical protein